ncbi:hypothetical protein [Kitasatospora sp. NPDC089509]|uniref:hypothetical protein n=1 Tax=Kitasatospora sp. NPDC089509 TaxID=3364079 RepID=UPI00381AE9E4
MSNPLMMLRAGMGLSQPEYARLVAERHVELGFGQMAARREKVSRWESGRIAPEHTAQLAMAHIHGVADGDVVRLGWPHWLYMAVGDGLLSGERHDFESAVAALRGSVQLAGAPGPPGLVVRGAALARQLRAVGARVAAPEHGRGREGPPAARDLVEWLDGRISALERQHNRSSLAPTALYTAALAEHRIAVRLLTTAGYDARTGGRLIALAARTGLRCGWFSHMLGEYARAERQALAAMRAAAAAGEPALVSEAMMLLAIRHLEAGAPADARLLVRAARTIDPRLPPDSQVVLHAEDAMARARGGEESGAVRELDKALEKTTGLGGDPEVEAGLDVMAQRFALSLVQARVALGFGYLHEAGRYIDAAVPYLITPQAGPRCPHTGVFLLQALDARIALGELDRAVTVVHQALAAVGALPPALTVRYRKRLVPFQGEPLVRHALDELTEAGSA